MSEIKRCPICKRSKSKAIQEQISQKQGCDIAGCVFIQEIIDAINYKPKIQVEKKEKLKINIVKKK